MNDFNLKNNRSDNKKSDVGMIDALIKKTNKGVMSASQKQFTKRERFYLGREFYNEYLTKTELVVLQHILLGKTAMSIADDMNISRRTVEYHTENLKLKMQCKTKGEIIAKAIKFIFLVEGQL